MREILAEQLLARVMNWDAPQIAVERPVLQTLATFKYDEYQQFSPGMRFIESLVLWLQQFGTLEERTCAYLFIRSRLIFFSNAQMRHFVTLAFQDIMRPLLIGISARELNEAPFRVKRIVNSTVYRSLRRQSLILGLSDGAHLDWLRRATREISHEQVWQTYDIPESKVASMLTELNSDLLAIMGGDSPGQEAKFRNVFLIDDFSASGLSYFRRDTASSTYKGKIYKVLTDIYESGTLSKLVDEPQLRVCVILYVATEHALSYLTAAVADWFSEQGRVNTFELHAVQVIPASVEVTRVRDGDFYELLPKYFDNQIVDRHYRVGRYGEPYLGFDQCALPLILSHNTPNDSLPILWFGETMDVRGLFPRVSRHRIDI